MDAEETNLETSDYIDMVLETWNRVEAINIFNKFKELKQKDIPECCSYAGQKWWEWGMLVDHRGKPYFYESGWG